MTSVAARGSVGLFLLAASTAWAQFTYRGATAEKWIARFEKVDPAPAEAVVARVTGVEGYDWEDIHWATNFAFWKMIQERRKEEGIPLDEVCRRLGVPLLPPWNGKRRKPQ